jgi:hypothetical protein
MDLIEITLPKRDRWIPSCAAYSRGVRISFMAHLFQSNANITDILLKAREEYVVTDYVRVELGVV